MRRILTVLGVAALMAVMFAPVALAVDKQCSRLPCFGTDARDTLGERGGEGIPDEIKGLRYGDRIYATAFGADRDVLNGNRGDDVLDSQDGDRRDTVNGGYGYDECLVDRPAEVGWGCDVVVVVGYAIEEPVASPADRAGRGSGLEERPDPLSCLQCPVRLPGMPTAGVVGRRIARTRAHYATPTAPLRESNAPPVAPQPDP